MRRFEADEGRIRELEDRLAQIDREYTFADSRALAHSAREDLRERMLFAGAKLRMAELVEERIRIVAELVTLTLRNDAEKIDGRMQKAAEKYMRERGERACMEV